LSYNGWHVGTFKLYYCTCALGLLCKHVNKYRINYYYIFVYLKLRSQDSVVSIVTGYGLNDRGVRVLSPGRVKNFVFSTASRSRPALGPTQPPMQWVLRALYPRVKRQGREADHSPQDSAEVKKMWIYTSTPPYALMA
jgi:hypothetical protein